MEDSGDRFAIALPQQLPLLLAAVGKLGPTTNSQLFTMDQ